jgi:replicative DNA helicase
LSKDIENEFGVANYLVCHPKIVKQITLDPQWFINPQFRHLAEVLVAHNGDFKDGLAVKQLFEQDYPGQIEPLMWQQLHAEITTDQHFPGYLKALKTNYHRELMVQDSYNYAKLPTQKNLLALQAQAQLMLSLNQPELTTLTMGEQGQALVTSLGQPRASGIRTYAALDDILGEGLQGGMLVTIGARPGVGKSAFGLNLTQKVFDNQPAAYIDYFSLEMTAAENYRRIMAYQTGLAVGKLINPYVALSEKQKDHVRQVAPILADQHLWLHDQFLVLSQIIKVIREHAQIAQQAKQPYLAVLDYLQITALNRVRNRVSDRRLEVEAITRELKLLANELNIPILLFSQLNREMDKRVDRTPQLSDLRESGSIEQDSNCVAFLYYDDPLETQKRKRRVNLIFRKNRSGSLGELNFQFDTQHMYFKIVLDATKGGDLF